MSGGCIGCSLDLTPACTVYRYVFVHPPSMELLEERLRGRGTETEDKIVKRLANAKGELDFAETPGFYDAHVVNDDFERAYAELKFFLSLL